MVVYPPTTIAPHRSTVPNDAVKAELACRSSLLRPGTHDLPISRELGARRLSNKSGSGMGLFSFDGILKAWEAGTEVHISTAVNEVVLSLLERVKVCFSWMI